MCGSTCDSCPRFLAPDEAKRMVAALRIAPEHGCTVRVYRVEVTSAWLRGGSFVKGYIVAPSYAEGRAFAAEALRWSEESVLLYPCSDSAVQLAAC